VGSENALQLTAPYSTIGRAKQMRMDVLFSSIEVGYISKSGGFPAVAMVVGMIAHLMTFVNHSLKKLGVGLYIFAQNKKGSLCTVFPKDI
jgi:hypothetical protein